MRTLWNWSDVLGQLAVFFRGRIPALQGLATTRRRGAAHTVPWTLPTCAVPRNRGDDPPVLVEVDSGDPLTWQSAAETFSTWARCQAEDRLALERAMFAASTRNWPDWK